MYEVRQTGVPAQRKNVAKYPWRQLTKIGMSFDVPVDEEGFHTIRTTAQARHHRDGRRYSCRVVRDAKTRAVLAMRVTLVALKPS